MGTVLIVEDDPRLARDLALEMSLAGHEVTTVIDGKMALETLESLTPDVILCDVMMPEMDGHDLLKNIRARCLAVGAAFYFMTALGTPQDQERGLALGATGYLVKPVDFAELHEVLAGVFEQRLRSQVA